MTRKQEAHKAAARAAIQALLEGKSCASAVSLSRSYGLPESDVRHIMRVKGVTEND